MSGVNPGNSPIAGSSDETKGEWMSVGEIIARLRLEGYDISPRQLERWRERKLLSPGVHLIMRAGHGGSYLFPSETVARAIAIVRLLDEKDDLDWVGHQLWWHGFEIDEQWWRPALVETASVYQPVLDLIGEMVRNERESESERDDTLADRIAPHLWDREIGGRILASRIIGRVSFQDMPTFLRVLFDAASGVAPEFEDGPDALDISVLKSGMDLTASENHKLAGQKFNFVDSIEPVMRDIARALAPNSLAEAARAPAADLSAARDDLMRALELAPTLYKSTKWIYGDEAFGLRFASWVSLKSPPVVRRLYLLIWLQMRRSGADILSSEEIRELQSAVLKIAEMFNSLYALRTTNAEIGKLLTPKQLKALFSGEIALEPFCKKLHSACLAVSAGQPNADAEK